MAKAQPTNENILRAVRNELSLEVQNRMPEVTTQNLSQVYDDIMNYKPLRNEIVPALIERIGLQTVDSMAWRNPLARFKKEPMRYGSTHEETYVNMCKGKVYDSRESYEMAFQQYQAYIMSVFHKVNLKTQYPVTITRENLLSAFTSERGIKDMITAKMESAFTGANWDEYLAMKNLIDLAYKKQLLPAVTVSEVTDDATARELLTKLKTAVYEFGFPNPANNIAGATSSAGKQNLVWITTPKTNATIGVEALAYAFNMDKADVEVQTIVIDKFENPAVQGVLCDIRFFNVREQFRELTDQRLANVLSWNYFYTMVEMISASPFYPIRVFTTDVVAGSGMTVQCTASTYKAGVEQTIEASLTGGTGTYRPELLSFEIVSGATSRDTFMLPATPILVTGADETGTIKVKITYRGDESITKTVSLTKTE